MRKLITLVLLLLAVVIHAQQITPDEAAAIASEFLSSSSPQPAATKHVGIRRAKAKSDADNDLSRPYYVFNGDDNQGFVIVSGDKRAKKILGYSDTGTFDFNNLPPQLAAMLEQYAEQINSLPESAATDPSWSTPTRAASAGEGKLLETANWGQGYPYNLQCPEVEGQKCLTGCVATAMAIVMKYNNWPAKGRGSHKYNVNPLGEIKLDECNYENIDFDYNVMDKENDSEISKLMRTAGHSVNMTYGVKESGTYIWVAPNALRRFFRYSPECQYIEKSHFTDSEWTDMIANQIDAGHPIIYSGFTDQKEGHAFVIDGYDNDLYHINWGWNGSFNGYFALSPTNDHYIPEYNERQGMVINIVPDYSDKQYSPCWIDYGYLWRENDSDPLVFVNPGTCVYPAVFEKGKQFDFFSKTINVPVDYPCSFGLAVIDENENIKTIIPAFMTIEEGTYCLFCGINYTWNGVTLSNIISIPDDLPENYTLQVASKKEGSDKWELILGTMEAPSKCRFDGSENSISNINYSFNNVDGSFGNPDNDESKFVYSVNKVDPSKSILGSGYWGTYKANNGIANLYLNGKWVSNTDDVYRTSIQFTTLSDHYDIMVDYIDNNDLKDISVENVSAGNIKDILKDCKKIRSLTIKGTLNAEDLAYITENCISLQHLDLSEVTISSFIDEHHNEYEANKFPTDIYRPVKSVDATDNIWNVKSLKLPNSMKGWNGDAFALGGRNMVALSMPVNHTSEFPEYYICGGSSLGDKSYQFVNCLIDNASDPVSNVIFPDYVNKYGHLFVPHGMTEKFRAAPGWGDFKYITEVDKPFVGNIVEKEGAQYILLSDCAVLLCAPFDCFHKHFAMANEITYNNETYPVKYMASQSLLARDIRHIEFPEYFETLDLNFIFGSTSITLNKNLKQIVPQESPFRVGEILCLRNDEMLDLSMLDSYVAFTEKLTPNFSTSNSVTRLYVPGAAIQNYESSLKNVSNINEMWSYQINKKYNVLKIESLCPEVEINRIILNGSPVNPFSGKYEFESISNLDVVVEYTVNGVQSMTTHYTPEFNTSLPNSDLGLVSEINLNETSLELFVGQYAKLVATVLPETTTDKTVTWSSSDETIATVDAEGKVIALAVGEAIITATVADGSGVSASCQVTVIMPDLGDSNANGTVNIADAVNTANYAVGNEVENFCFEAADVNADGEVTVADASGTVTIILVQPVQESRQRAYSLPATSSDEVDCLRVADYSATIGETATVGISFDNSIDYVALQADIILPEGLTLQSVAGSIRATGHILTTREIDSRRVRVVLFDLGNSAFVDSRESLIELKVRVDSDNAGDIVIENIIASDVAANEYRLASTGGHNNTITKTEGVASKTIQIEATSGAINVYNATGSTVAVYGVDGRVLTRFVAKNEAEHYQTTPGIYIVSVGSRMVKVVVK
ncbi:MAG: C10 family peptidase [Prevotella sp.]|nr:C10 family peptidase [Prevotella sp.]